MRERQEKLRSVFDELRIDAFLVTVSAHLRYVSNFSGSHGVGIVTRNAAYLVTDGRYSTHVKQEVHDWKVLIAAESLFDKIQRLGLLKNGWRVGFDGNGVSYSTYRSLQKHFPEVKFAPKADVIESLAVVKEKSEIKKIRRAITITDTVFGEILDCFRPGIRELDIAAEITFRQRKHGASGDGFEPIVASGIRGALPHGRATSKKIMRGELVTLDFGCVFEGYHSDLTRTVALGKPSGESRKMYRTVLEAQSQAIEAATDGMAAKDLDAVARVHINKKGYGKYFNHSLGHGLGLQLHEPPRVSAFSKARLHSGNVITIEPGIYVPEVGGVRIEDDVLINNGSCTVLSRASKELIVL